MPSCISPLYIYTKNPVNSSCNNPFDIPMIFRFHPGFRLSQDLQVTMPWKALVLSFALNCRRSEKSKQTHRGDHGLSLFVVWGSVKKGGWGSQRKGEFMGLAWKVWEMPHISSSKMGWNMVQAHQKIKLSFCGKMQGFLKSTFRIRLAIFNFGTPVWDRNVLYSDWTKKNRNLLASTIKSWKIWCVNSSKVWLISPVICVWSKDQKLKKKYVETLDKTGMLLICGRYFLSGNPEQKFSEQASAQEGWSDDIYLQRRGPKVILFWWRNYPKFVVV
jgi:hypothetical protein